MLALAAHAALLSARSVPCMEIRSRTSPSSAGACRATSKPSFCGALAVRAVADIASALTRQRRRLGRGWTHDVASVLLMDPRGKRVVIADNVLTPRHVKLALAQCLFDEFHVRPSSRPAAPQSRGFRSCTRPPRALTAAQCRLGCIALPCPVRCTLATLCRRRCWRSSRPATTLASSSTSATVARRSRRCDPVARPTYCQGEHNTDVGNVGLGTVIAGGARCVWAPPGGGALRIDL